MAAMADAFEWEHIQYASTIKQPLDFILRNLNQLLI